MSTKKADKTPRQQSGSEQDEQPKKGRVHTIAKPRPTAMKKQVAEEPDATTPTTTTPTAPDDGSEIVVFAFRLSRAERREIGDATGSAKASKFVRALALAGARGDMKAVEEIVEAVQASRQ